MRGSKELINIGDITLFGKRISRCGAGVVVASAVLLMSNIFGSSSVFAETRHRQLGRTYTIHVNYNSSRAPAPNFGGDDFTVALVGSKMVLTKSESKGGRHSGAWIPIVGGKGCSLWNFTSIVGYNARTSLTNTCFTVAAIEKNFWQIDAESTERLAQSQEKTWKRFSFNLWQTEIRAA
jgi:hypothetical protein